jgi:cell division protein FtsW
LGGLMTSNRQFSKLHQPDYYFLLNLLALLGIGLLMILSASPIVGLKHYADPFFFIKRHLFFLILGAGVFVLGLRVPLGWLRQYLFLIIGATFLVLLLTHVPGLSVNAGGATRWLNLGFVVFQPSELAKLTLVFFAAHAFVNKQKIIRDFIKGVLPVFGFAGILILLVLKQPDLGTAMLLAITLVVMGFVAGARTWQLAVFLLVGFRVLLWHIWQTPYQKQRILAFMDPWKDPLGIGFQMVQSLLAVGSGGILGLGLGQSRQKVDFLPQQFTDFIFAIIAEEGGLLVAGLIVILFIIFLFRGMRLALLLKSPYEQLLACGLTVSIVIQAFLNMMMVLALAPTTGIPLPFISYGGTSLMVSLFACGILTQLSRKVPN